MTAVREYGGCGDVFTELNERHVRLGGQSTQSMNAVVTHNRGRQAVMTNDPWAIDPSGFAALMATVEECADDCVCDDCTFINMIPSMLDAEGVER